LNKNIIIVEDDPFSQYFYKYILAKQGYAVQVMEDGNQLMNTIEERGPDLIIMDINLKNTYYDKQKVDGVFLSKMIKQNHPGIPVLLITAYTINADGPGFYKDSLADDYISKPVVDYKKVLLKIKNMIKDE
jgi:two-component system, cell cycle response regulator DivK